MENSNEGVANAKPGDTILRDNGTVYTLTQGDIDWAKTVIETGNTTTGTQAGGSNSGETTTAGSITFPSDATTGNNHYGTDITVPTVTVPSISGGNESVPSNGVQDNGSNLLPTIPENIDVIENSSQPQIVYTPGDNASWGSIDNENNRNKKMQDYQGDEEKDSSMHDPSENVDYTYSHQGCKMDGAAQVISESTGKDISIGDVNDKYDTDGNGLLTNEEIAAAIILNLESDKKLTTDIYSNSSETLNKNTLDNIANSDGTTYVLGQAEGVCGDTHWFVLEGYTVNEEGILEFNYNGTSINDTGRTYILGPVDSSQKKT